MSARTAPPGVVVTGPASGIGRATCLASPRPAGPSPRIADPADVARVVRFLLPADAAYVHDTHLVADGGHAAVGG